MKYEKGIKRIKQGEQKSNNVNVYEEVENQPVKKGNVVAVEKNTRNKRVPKLSCVWKETDITMTYPVI